MEPERKTAYKIRKILSENFRKGRWKMDKKRLLRAAAIFFSCMICFTILSRAANQAGIAAVATERPQNMMITHSVKVSGRIVQNQALAVTTEPDQRVTAIYVREGERVKKGDLLFEVDPLLLEEKILYQRQEMEKQRLQVQDAKSQKDVSAQQKANEQAQASEQYSLTTRSAAVQLSRAKENLEEAKKKLKEFQPSSNVVQEESMVESALEQALEEKSEAYIQANQELSSLQWQIENEVDSLPDLNALTDEQDGDDLPDLNAITDGQDTDIIIDEIEIDSRPLNEEEKKQLEQSVRNKYEQKLASARKKVEVALEEKEAAEQALVKCHLEQNQLAEGQSEEKKNQLLENLKAAQQAYEDAAIAANEAAVISGRAVYSAGIPDPLNSSDRMNEITYEQMELSLQKLEKLKEENGKIYAGTDGLILDVSIQTGEKTTDTMAVLMADLEKGCRFYGDISKEQEKYIGVGDLVSLEGGNGKTKVEELPVETVTEDEEDGNLYHITVQIPADVFEIGMAVSLEYTKKSQAYPLTVPLSALHLDEKNQSYVLVAEEYASIMGEGMQARKVPVTVLEKNEEYAALAQGTLDSSQEIIVSSNKTIEDGSLIRVE